MTQPIHEHETALDTEGKRKLLARLKRAEGQLVAVQRMVDEDTYCVDVLLQVAAIQGALKKAGHVLLRAHIDHCVTRALRSGDEVARARRIDELMEVFNRYGGL
jgi:DNA-binding FrmR family transcriptional regulator